MRSRGHPAQICTHDGSPQRSNRFEIRRLVSIRSRIQERRWGGAGRSDDQIHVRQNPSPLRQGIKITTNFVIHFAEAVKTPDLRKRLQTICDFSSAFKIHVGKDGDSGISLASEILTGLLTTTSRSNTTDIQPLARRFLVIILCPRASEMGRNEGETECPESAPGQKLPTIRGGQRIFHDSSSDDLSRLLLQP